MAEKLNVSDRKSIRPYLLLSPNQSLSEPRNRFYDTRTEIIICTKYGKNQVEQIQQK